MFRLYRVMIAVGALLGLLMGALPGPSLVYAAERQCFAETNQCIEGRFLEYWRANGGLPVFGYPITAARNERNRDTGKTYLTQWFERNRFEFHPENARPYDVLLGRLGEDNLLKLGRDWRREYRAERPEDVDCEQRTTDGKVFLLCGPIRGYYKTHGLEFDGRPGFSEAESLALFGLPLTQAKMETNASGDTVLTQWFERARIEFHPAKAEPYKVLLGLLGNALRLPGPQQPVSRLQYFWPGFTPGDLSVLQEGSFANEQMWLLHLAQPHAQRADVTIGGGVEGGEPGRKLQDVTVRGQRGTTFASGVGYAVVWSEQGRVYAVSGKRSLNELLRIAEGLAPVDRGTWQQRLDGDSAPRTLKYFWPGREQHELVVWPEPHGGSLANATSFKLNLYRVHARQPNVTILGGELAQPTQRVGQAVTVRGQQGTAYQSGAGYTVAWIENEQRYMITSDLGLADVLELAAGLEVLDLQTFRTRIRPQ